MQPGTHSPSLAPSEDIGASFRGDVVRAAGFEVFYFSAGQGPVLLALHGSGAPRMSRVLDLLSRQFRVILMQMPGFGSSEINTRTNTFEDMALVVAEAASNLFSSPFHLLGTSFGAVVALQLAASRPETIYSLVLEGPAGIRRGAPPPGSVPIGQILSLVRRHPERRPHFNVMDLAPSAPHASLVRRIQTNFEGEHWLIKLLAKITVPTLVLFGEADGVIPAHNGSVYTDNITTCRFEIIPDAAHDIQGDAPEAMAASIQSFLDALTRARFTTA